MDRISTADRDAVIAMHRNGMTIDEITFSLNLRRKQVQKVIWHHLGPKKPYKERIPVEVSMQILEMYEAGIKPWLIAKKLGVPATSVYSVGGYQRRKEFHFLRKKIAFYLT